MCVTGFRKTRERGMEIVEALKWPVVVVLFMIIFRKPISELIRRIKKVTPRGFDTSDDQTQAQIPADRAVDDLMKAFDSIVLKGYEKLIYDQLKDKGLEASGDTTKVLVHHLASTQVQLHLELILSGIWQSQVQVLEVLNTSGSSLTDEDLAQIYEGAAGKYPLVFETYPFNAYMDHLIRSNLVIKSGDAYSITNLGVEFLQYVARYGRRPARPF